MSFADLEELAEEDEMREGEIIELEQLSGIWTKTPPVHSIDDAGIGTSCRSGSSSRAEHAIP
jgi:hypothetical protein